MSLFERTRIAFAGGNEAVVVLVPADVSGEDAVAALGLEPPRGLIVVNGGTAELEPAASAALRPSLAALARVAADAALTLVTGGTDAGVFALLGDALTAAPPAACVGVASHDRGVDGGGGGRYAPGTLIIDDR